MDSEVFPELESQIVSAVNRIQNFGVQQSNLIGRGQQRLLEQLSSQLSETTSSLMSTVQSSLMGRIVEVAKSEVEFEMGLIKGNIPIEWEFNRPSEGQLRTILQNQPFDGKPLSDWFSDMSDSATRRTTQAVRQGMVEGEGIDEIMRRIRGTRGSGYTDGVLGTTRRHAESLARSAVIHTSNQASQELYRQNDDLVKGVKHVATLDSNTCPRCSVLDGEVFDIDEGPRPPVHPNCRCATTPVLKSWRELGIDLDEAPEGTRASMDGQVPESMTYNEWLSKQPLEVVKEALGPTRAKLYREGNISVSSFVDRQGRFFTLEELRRKERDVFEQLGIELN